MLEFFFERPFLYLAVIFSTLLEVNIADRFDQRLGEIMGMQMVWPFIFVANWVILLGISHILNSVFQNDKKKA